MLGSLLCQNQMIIINSFDIIKMPLIKTYNNIYFYSIIFILIIIFWTSKCSSFLSVKINKYNEDGTKLIKIRPDI